MKIVDEYPVNANNFNLYRYNDTLIVFAPLFFGKLPHVFNTLEECICPFKVRYRGQRYI